MSKVSTGIYAFYRSPSDYSIPPPRTYVFEPIRTYGTFDLEPTENVTETTKVQ